MSYEIVAECQRCLISYEELVFSETIFKTRSRYCGSCTQAKSDQVGNFESVKMSLSDDILFKEFVQNFSPWIVLVYNRSEFNVLN